VICVHVTVVLSQLMTLTHRRHSSCMSELSTCCKAIGLLRSSNTLWSQWSMML